MKSGPFDFYQQITGLFYDDGQPAPFSLFRVNESGFSGVYFPAQAVLGAPIRLLDDDAAFPAKFNITFKGNVDKQLSDINSYLISFTGDFFPSPPDFKVLAVANSGNITGDNIDNVGFSVPFLGNINSGLGDFPKFIISGRGNILSEPLDKPNYIINFSGNIIQPSPEPVGFSSQFFGSLIGKARDIGSIDFGMYSISCASGKNRIFVNTFNTGSFSFGMNAVIIQRAA